MRFAFEGFFNWVEKGEWSTSSTEKLNREMWIWPNDQRTWLIGSGLLIALFMVQTLVTVVLYYIVV